MKKILVLALCSIILVSCGKKDETQETPSQIPSPQEENAVIESSWEGLGTEPFFAFRFLSGSLTWEEPGESGTISTSFSGASTQSGSSITIIAGDFTGSLTLWTCSDGMSDNVYPYTLSVQKDIRTLSGCARPYNP